jgi:hypothetical protein
VRAVGSGLVGGGDGGIALMCFGGKDREEEENDGSGMQPTRAMCACVDSLDDGTSAKEEDPPLTPPPPPRPPASPHSFTGCGHSERWLPPRRRYEL